MGKYERVYQDLSSKIDDGTYPVGSLLPSEKQLTENYSVSRETARKALALLTDRGYIQKIMGKGSIVISHSQYALPVSSLVSYTEFSSSAQTRTHSEVFALEPATLPIATFKSLVPNVGATPATFVGRLRYFDNEPAIIDRDYVLTSVVPNVPRTAAENSLFQYFEETLALSIAYSSKQIKVEPATENDRKLMNLAKGEYVAVTTSVTSLEDTTAFLFTESRHRADKFIYQDFARRRSTKWSQER